MKLKGGFNPNPPLRMPLNVDTTVIDLVSLAK